MLVWARNRGLGDAVDDLIVSSGDSDFKVRLAATLSLGKIIKRDPRDKRAVAAITTRLADGMAGTRGVAINIMVTPGWLDATVDPCLRNRAFASLEALAEKDPIASNRLAAKNAVELLAALGVPDASPATIARCKDPSRPPFEIPPGPDVGPLVDPTNQPPASSGMTTGTKVVIGLAAAGALGTLAYVLLGPSSHS